MYTPRSEEERIFLENYDPQAYDSPAVAADCTLFAYDAQQGKMYVLLIERGNFPYKGCLALPGGFVEMDEHIHDAIKRELIEETGISDIPVYLYYAMGAPNRDPRGRVITVQYISLVSKKDVHPVAGDDAKKAVWFEIYICENEGIYEVNLKGSVDICARVRRTHPDSTYYTQDFEIIDSADLAFDHAKVLVYAVNQLRLMLKNTPLAQNVLGLNYSKQDLKKLLESV